MAEISYPFAAASAGGGSELVSQVEWQNMSHLWGPDRVDFQLTSNSYTSASLPLNAEIVGTDIVIQSGSAWVGGFYYKNDAPLTIPVPTNSGATDRIDLVVVRLDMSVGSANLAIKTGQAASNPVEPAVQRIVGGIWEMPLWKILVEKNNGARSLGDRRRYDSPGGVSVPWNATLVAGGVPSGSFIVDMDSNNNGGDTQQEFFKGRDGTFITRHLGERRGYTPDLFTVTNKPVSANRKGYYRYIAPGTVKFTVYIRNTSTKAVEASDSSGIIGFTLPVNATSTVPCVFHGIIDNPEVRNSLPNFIDIVTKNGGGGNRNSYLYYPNENSVSQGLDSLKLIPGKSELIITGVYETDDFD